MPTFQYHLSTSTRNRLADVVDQISDQVAHKQQKQSDLQSLLALGTMAAALPTCAVNGFFPALSLAITCCFFLYQARNSENNAKNVAEIGHRIANRIR